MPNKTIYIRNDDVSTWDDANVFADLHHQSLSQLIMQALRDYMVKKDES
jgi:hypothetical protein